MGILYERVGRLSWLWSASPCRVHRLGGRGTSRKRKGGGCFVLAVKQYVETETAPVLMTSERPSRWDARDWLKASTLRE